MLDVVGIHAHYGPVQAIENVSLSVGADKIVCLLGANGAGKTTTLNCISGVVPASAGRIRFNGEDITARRADAIVERGIVQVPEGREIFSTMSVEDNLMLGAWVRRDRAAARRELARVYDLFPRLAERTRQHAGTLSGGEQQMLMIGRALMAGPKLLMFDEPSLGLSPLLVQQVFEIIKVIHRAGVPILLVEQNARIALDVSDYGYILENGEVRLHGPTEALRNSPVVNEAYLGA